ncbi:MAG: N-acetylmuramoyl-L-alanine amidase [Desulfuromonadales bacterium]|nr:N-acetylmuramoyl-L-alanine amidase [Desulfuromonadales bacterium]
MSHLALKLFFLPFFLLAFVSPSGALVEVGRPGEEPLVIEDVYLREGTAFVSIDDVLAALELQGEWNSVAHVYAIRTPHGKAVISPGSQFLKLGDNFIPVAHRPRFIGGKLRVSETFLLSQLAPLLTEPIYYRNHNPPAPTQGDDPLDRLFAFLLRKKEPVADGSKWVVSIDPGHGGEDSGALGLNGSKEKTVTLAVSQRLEKLLKMHQDAPVILTRDGDYALDMERRLEVVAEGQADVMLSLHAQSFFSAETSGVNLYVQPQTERDVPDGVVVENSSLILAEILQKKLKNRGFDVHGIKELPVYPLGRGDLPRVMVEMGSLTNTIDLTILEDPIRQQDFARALFDGLQAFFDTFSGVQP